MGQEDPVKAGDTPRVHREYDTRQEQQGRGMRNQKY